MPKSYHVFKINSFFAGFVPKVLKKVIVLLQLYIQVYVMTIELPW